MQLIFYETHHSTPKVNNDFWTHLPLHSSPLIVFVGKFLICFFYLGHCAGNFFPRSCILSPIPLLEGLTHNLACWLLVHVTSMLACVRGSMLNDVIKLLVLGKLVLRSWFVWCHTNKMIPKGQFVQATCSICSEIVSIRWHRNREFI